MYDGHNKYQFTTFYGRTYSQWKHEIALLSIGKINEYDIGDHWQKTWATGVTPTDAYQAVFQEFFPAPTKYVALGNNTLEQVPEPLFPEKHNWKTRYLALRAYLLKHVWKVGL